MPVFCMQRCTVDGHSSVQAQRAGQLPGLQERSSGSSRDVGCGHSSSRNLSSCQPGTAQGHWDSSPGSSPAAPAGTRGCVCASCAGRVQVKLSPALQGEAAALDLLRSFASPLVWGSAKVGIDSALNVTLHLWFIALFISLFEDCFSSSS